VPAAEPEAEAAAVPLGLADDAGDRVAVPAAEPEAEAAAVPLGLADDAGDRFALPAAEPEAEAAAVPLGLADDAGDRFALPAAELVAEAAAPAGVAATADEEPGAPWRLSAPGRGAMRTTAISDAGRHGHAHCTSSVVAGDAAVAAANTVMVSWARPCRPIWTRAIQRRGPRDVRFLGKTGRRARAKFC